MKLFTAAILFLIISMPCRAQNTDPYKGKPFKPGDVRTLQLQIPVGKIMISCAVEYVLLDDPDGMFYSFGHRYKAQVNKATFTGDNKSNLPQDLINGFTDLTIELTGKEIMQKTIRTTSMYYWFTAQDFNLDGKPDFAFIGDLGYHSQPVNNYVWVNIGDKLVYWYGISDAVSEIKDKTKRIISIDTVQNGSSMPQFYKIEKDTFLVPVKSRH